MDKNIKVLCIKGKYYWIGIDLYEIKKVMEKSSDNEEINKILKKKNSQNKDFFTMKTFFTDENDELNSLIIIESLPGRREILFAVSGEVDIIETPLSNVLIIPEIIRKRQKNPYTWGIIKIKQTPVVLVTFSYLTNKE